MSEQDQNKSAEKTSLDLNERMESWQNSRGWHMEQAGECRATTAGWSLLALGGLTVLGVGLYNNSLYTEIGGGAAAGAIAPALVYARGASRHRKEADQYGSQIRQMEERAMERDNRLFEAEMIGLPAGQADIAVAQRLTTLIKSGELHTMLGIDRPEEPGTLPPSHGVPPQA